MDTKYKKTIIYLIAIGAIIILILIKLIGLEDTIRTIKLADKGLLVLAVLIQFVILGIRAFRWELLLKDRGEYVGLRYLYGIILIGSFANNVTPGARMGGEPLRAYLLKRNFGIKARKGFATIVVERIYDFLILAVMAFISYLYVISMVNIGGRSKLIITALMAILILFLTGVANAIFSERIANKIFRYLPERYKGGFMEAFSTFRKNSINMIKNVSLFLTMAVVTTILWLLDVLRVLILFYSLDYSVSFLAITMVFTLTVFLSTLPFLPGGLGLSEGAMAGLYVAIGIPLVITVIVTILDRLIHYWLMILCGGVAAMIVHIQEVDVSEISPGK